MDESSLFLPFAGKKRNFIRHVLWSLAFLGQIDMVKVFRTVHFSWNTLYPLRMILFVLEIGTPVKDSLLLSTTSRLYCDTQSFDSKLCKSLSQNETLMLYNIVI